MNNEAIVRVEEAAKALRNGEMIILTDHPDRENEGDLIFPAEIVTPEVINFMIQYCSGIICLSLLEDKLNALDLHSMVPSNQNTSQRGTPFMTSIEAKMGVTTGVSAHDRATTILAAVKQGATAQDIVKPGHVFPLKAQEGGVLTRQGHTEGAIDIVRLAGFNPAAVLCEIMNPDGTMARGQQLDVFAVKHNLKMLSIDDIITYRLSKENIIAEEVSTELPLENYGSFTMTVIKEKFTDHEHIVLTSMKPLPASPLVRIHSACTTGDLFGSKRCDCNKQLHYSLKRIHEEGGVLIYLNQEGRGIGLFNKIKTYALQDKGMDTVDANISLGLSVDSREYYLAANILRNKNMDNIRLLTNNPLKISGLLKYGIQNVKMEVLPSFNNTDNINYLRTKKEKLNHVINIA